MIRRYENPRAIQNINEILISIANIDINDGDDDSNDEEEN